MGTVTRGGISIHYEAAGAGPAVVLTHSFLCDGELWRHQVPELSRAHRVINIDNRGHGRSGPSESPYSIYDLVEDTVAVLDAEGIGSAVWAGLSIGGFISLRAALERPERVRALIFADTDAGPESGWKKFKYRMMKWGLVLLGPGSIMPLLMPIMFGRTTMRARPQLREEYRQKFYGMRVKSIVPGIGAITSRDDLLPRLGEIKVPTLVMVGDEDAPLPPERSRRIAGGIPGADLAVIPRAGHLSAVENPEPVTEAMLRFLARLPS